MIIIPTIQVHEKKNLNNYFSKKKIYLKTLLTGS